MRVLKNGDGEMKFGVSCLRGRRRGEGRMRTFEKGFESNVFECAGFESGVEDSIKDG